MKKIIGIEKPNEQKKEVKHYDNTQRASNMGKRHAPTSRVSTGAFASAKGRKGRYEEVMEKLTSHKMDLLDLLDFSDELTQTKSTKG